MYKRLQGSAREIKEISFGTESLKQDYLDILEEVKSDAMYTAKYDENSDTGTTHSGMPKLRR